ncbi:integral membrane protein [Intrasporangium oryzae NRRL B-24470]|uniref:Integral membrane protein n=1 Tax=Intrasporangium oryzae NRRL B-24470 TaxID=1386089 RepID=W9G2D0_9MICO|nr:integral membrane protein [Intrasporangium oryzae NRRL B-24470]
MLPGVTVTSANAAVRSHLSESRLAHALENPDRDAERRQPFYRRFAFWFPLAVYAVSRIYVLVAGIVLARNQIALPIGTPNIRIFFPLPASPGYLSAMTNWDGQWYRVIAENGYPAVLPRAGWGGIDMNPWAFFPVFPLTAGAIMKVTGLPFVVVAPILSTLIGFAAMYFLFKLVDQAVGRWEAIVAVVATCFYIASPVFSASYTESLALLMVVVVLLLLRARRYAWVVPALLVLSLSRNVVIAMVPVITAHAVVRWWQGDEGPHPKRFRWGMAALAAYAGALTFLWPKIVAIATDTPNAYEETMLAWNIQTKVKLYMWWNLLYAYWGIWGQLLGVLGVAAFAWFMLTKNSWRWGPEIWGWAGAYPAYIILVTSTTPSRVRYALLAFPFTLVIAWFLKLRWWERWRYWLLAGIVVVGAVQMWWWLEHYLVIENLTDDLYP